MEPELDAFAGMWLSALPGESAQVRNAPIMPEAADARQAHYYRYVGALMDKGWSRADASRLVQGSTLWDICAGRRSGLAPAGADIAPARAREYARRLNGARINQVGADDWLYVLTLGDEREAREARLYLQSRTLGRFHDDFETVS